MSLARLAGRAGKPSFQSQFDALSTTGIDLADFVPKLMAETRDASHIDADGLEDPMAQTVIRVEPGARASWPRLESRTWACLSRYSFKSVPRRRL